MRYNAVWLSLVKLTRFAEKLFINKTIVNQQLTHFCSPFKLVFYQHLNSHKTYPDGIAAESSRRALEQR